MTTNLNTTNINRNPAEPQHHSNSDIRSMFWQIGDLCKKHSFVIPCQTAARLANTISELNDNDPRLNNMKINTTVKRSKTMSHKLITTLFLTCGVLFLISGCGDVARTDFNNKLNSAYSQLQNNRPSSAMSHIEQAGKIAEENTFDQTEVKKLKAEACLGVGDLICAYDQAKELLDKDAENPFGLELLGKVCIKDNRFSEAEEHLVKAQKAFESPFDIARVTDLIAVARGLSAYSKGNPKLADRWFRSIENTDLQFSIDKAQKNVSANNF